MKRDDDVSVDSITPPPIHIIESDKSMVEELFSGNEDEKNEPTNG